MRSKDFQSAILKFVYDARSKRRFRPNNGQIDLFACGKACKFCDMGRVDWHTPGDWFNASVARGAEKFERPPRGFSQRPKNAVFSSPSSNNKYFHIKGLRTFSHRGNVRN